MTASPEPVLRTRRVDYSRWGLRSNPFPMAGLAGTQTPFPLIDEVVDDEVHKYIQETIQSKEYCGLAILGEYGSGKTYALHYVETLLGSIEENPDTQEILVVYVERPQSTLKALVADVCNRIGRLHIRNLLLEMILTDLAEIAERGCGNGDERFEALCRACKTAAAQDLFADPDALRQLLTADAIMNPAGTLDRVRRTVGGADFLVGFAAESIEVILASKDRRMQDVARHLAQFALASPEKCAALWKAFVNGKIRLSGRTILEISGRDVWFCVMQVLGRAGCRMVYWLIDEFEELELQRKRWVSLNAFLAELRDLVDANLEGFGLVVASKGPSWDIYKDINTAFSQRFSRVVHLKPSSAEGLRQMIEGLLRSARETECGSEIAPFTEKAVQQLHAVSGGNTRVAVQTCHILLWHAAAEGLTEITESLVEDWADISHSYFYARQGASGE